MNLIFNLINCMLVLKSEQNLRTLQVWISSTHKEEHPAVPTEGGLEKLAVMDERLGSRLAPMQFMVKRAVTLSELLKAERMTLSMDPDGVSERQLMMTKSYVDANGLLI